MNEADARQDEKVYQFIGMLVVAVSRLEHALDRAILAINDSYPAWLLSTSPKLPMKVEFKLPVIIKFIEEDQLGLGIRLRPEFEALVNNIFNIRNALLHGDLRGWDEPIEHPETAIYVTRLVREPRNGKSWIGLTTAIVRFDVVRQMIARAEEFAREIESAIPFSIADEEAVEVSIQVHRDRSGFERENEETC